ncbi:MAG: response regulator [Deltaproteobacteria bacterium]|nr:response regulator [Deltaproteobacteria bacterium]
MNNDDRPYTTGEVADMSSVTINAVKKWISAGKLNAFRTPGGHYRIRRDDFKTFVNKYRFQIKESLFPEQSRILIADDDTEILTLFVKAIEHRFGSSCLVETASDGYEALVKLGSFKPTLLVLDIRMPRIDGIEVCRRIRSGGLAKGMLKILAVTAFGAAEAERVKEAGADECLLKPLTIDAFNSAVAKLIGTTREAAL